MGEVFATNFLLQIGIELSFVSFTHNLLIKNKRINSLDKININFITLSINVQRV